MRKGREDKGEGGMGQGRQGRGVWVGVWAAGVSNGKSVCLLT